MQYRCRFGLILLSCFFVSITSHAQLIFQATLAHDRVVKYEPIVVELVIQNKTSRNLEIGGKNTEAHLACSIRQLRGSYVSGYPGTFFPAFLVPARSTVTNEINLLEFYDLRKAACYAVDLQIRWSGKKFSPAKLFVDVQDGAEIMSTVDYVEEAGGFLKYSLLSMHRDAGGRLFFKIEDEEKKLCYGVHDIGSSVQLYKPSMLMSAAGFMHILHQSSPTLMIHSVFRRDGTPVSHDSYQLVGGQPVLAELEDGTIMVDGASMVEMDEE